jgi:hypothetical protein
MSCTSKILGALELAAAFVTSGPSLTSTSAVMIWPGGHSTRIRVVPETALWKAFLDNINLNLGTHVEYDLRGR